MRVLVAAAPTAVVLGVALTLLTLRPSAPQPCGAPAPLLAPQFQQRAVLLLAPPLCVAVPDPNVVQLRLGAVVRAPRAGQRRAALDFPCVAPAMPARHCPSVAPARQPQPAQIAVAFGEQAEHWLSFVLQRSPGEGETSAWLLW